MFPWKNQNVYYAGMNDDGSIMGIATYTRNSYTKTEYGNFRTPIQNIKGNVTIMNGVPQSASVQVKR
ncbi:hypothetical protein D3C86_2123940 [compost metagenome]